MLAINRVTDIFANAYAMHAAALERLTANDLRDASEKAWCATLRASDALILARTGVEPERTPQTTAELQILTGQDNAVRSLLNRYYSRQVSLHGQCFYLGLCEPVADIERRIRETIDYIQDVENLALT